MKRVCVFAGSTRGVRPAYAAAARALGTALCRRGLGLVYGGGAVGLMGSLADATLAGGGEVTGVIPRGLATRELAHPGVSDLRVVESMHERKATMASLADAFVVLPGGLGTLEEALEILTWSQLGIHAKPIGALDVDGYWDGLRRMLAHAVSEGFVHAADAALLLIGATPEELLDRLAVWRPPVVRRAGLGPAQI